MKKIFSAEAMEEGVIVDARTKGMTYFFTGKTSLNTQYQESGYKILTW